MSFLRRLTGSLLARLTIGYILVAVVFAAAWTWSLYGPLTDSVLRQQERNLTAVAQSAALIAAREGGSPQTLAKQLVARTDLRLTIVASDGTVLADSDVDPTAMANHADRPEIAAALSGRIGSARRDSATEGTPQLYVAVPGSVDGRRVAVRVSQPLDEIDSIAGRSRRIGLALVAFALLVSAYVGYRATRTATRPVAALTEAASRMADGNLDAPVPPVPADLDSLARSLTLLRDEVRSRLAALESEKRTLASTLDGLDEAVFVFEADRLVLTNSGVERLFPASHSGWEGTSLAELSWPPHVARAVAIGLARHEPSCVELDADPTGQTLRVSVSPLEGAFVPRAIVVVADVTQRARLDRVRTDFVANASHELKTPVAGIRLLAESVDNAMTDGDTGAALAFAGQISPEVERLQRLVSDLLDLSRIETTPAPDSLINVREALERAVVSHRSSAARKGLEIISDLTAVSEESVFARMDATDLAIALDNLVDNAIAYTDAGVVTIRVDASEETVDVSVTDHGAGIPADKLDRIFERFYRVDPGRSRDAGGTGLGLALVKHVMERAGGSVDVSSTLGMGSTFTLRLPRAN